MHADHQRDLVLVQRVPDGTGAEFPVDRRARVTAWSFPYGSADVGRQQVGDADDLHQRPFGADEDRERVRHRAAFIRLRGAGLRRLDAAIGPTFGSGATGDYTFNAIGRYLAPFGETKTSVFRPRRYMFYPGRQEGQFDGALLIRRGLLQFGGAASFKTANLRSEASAGALSHATLTFDVLMPSMRFGLFGSEGLRETDVVTLSEAVGGPGPGACRSSPRNRSFSTIDQFGGSIQLPSPPTGGWTASRTCTGTHPESATPAVERSGSRACCSRTWCSPPGST